MLERQRQEEPLDRLIQAVQNGPEHKTAPIRSVPDTKARIQLRHINFCAERGIGIYFSEALLWWLKLVSENPELYASEIDVFYRQNNFFDVYWMRAASLGASAPEIRRENT